MQSPGSHPPDSDWLSLSGDEEAPALGDSDSVMYTLPPLPPSCLPLLWEIYSAIVQVLSLDSKTFDCVPPF